MTATKSQVITEQDLHPGDRVTAEIRWADGNGYTTSREVVERDKVLWGINGRRVWHYKGEPRRVSREIDAPISMLRLERYTVTHSNKIQGDN